MDIEAIMQQFILLTGLSEEEAAKWITFCSKALNDVSDNLKPTVIAADHSSKLNYLAATLAFYRYSLSLASSPDSGDFTVGDIKSTCNKNLMCKSAKMLYDEAKDSAKSILKDNEFYFGRCGI